VASSITGVGGAPYIVSLYTGPTVSDLDYDQVESIIRDENNWDDILVTITDPKQPTRYLADDASSPFAYDFNVAVKRALPKNTGTFTLTYTDRTYKDLLDDFVGDEGVSTVVDPAGSGQSFTFDTTVWDNAETARREYQALAATWDYRPNARWGLGGNWTYARSRGNYEGEGRNTPSSGSVIGDYVRSIPQGDAIPFGYVDEDIRDRVRAWANYRFDFDRAGNLTLGAIGTYQSPFSFSRTAARPLGLDPNYLNEGGTTYTHFFDGRGNNRLNGFWRLDLSSRYQIEAWKKLAVWLKLDILNLTNNDELIAWSTAWTSEINSAGVRVWAPSGRPALLNPNTGLPDVNYDPLNPDHVAGPSRFDCLQTPSANCTGFGDIRNAQDYQLPRSYFVSIGLQW
jgi:hypothetical protein